MSRALALLSILCAVCCLSFSARAFAEGITNSGDDLRTGWYPNESSITPQLVSGGTFGQMWSASVEGQVYAQPLLDGNTLLVATEANKVYGLNPANGALKWSSPLYLGTPWNPEDIKCGDLTPQIGATATPVIDPSTGIAYLTHKTYVSGTSGAARWYMDAVNVETGKEQPGFPVELAGEAQNAPGLHFSPATELQRPGLLLMNGVVYAGFGSDCDVTPFQGWVFGVTTGGQVKARWTAETDGDGGGIWQSGAGLTSDGPGKILLSTGNGGVPPDPTPGNQPPGSLGEAVVRLAVQPNGTLKATDFFAPYDAEVLAGWDADFASGGVTGLPDEYFGTSSVPHLAVAVGKDGYVYLLNRDNLGGIGEGTGGSDGVVQRIGPYGGVWSRPGVWPGEGGWVYIPTASNGESAAGSSGNLRVYKYGVSGSGAPTLSLEGTSEDPFGFSSSAPVVTSDGTTAGSALVWIVWAPNGSGEGAQLRAYDPVPVEGRPHLRWEAPVGTSTKFAMPGIGAGKIYIGTRDGHVLAFGSPVTPVLTGSATEFPTTTLGQESHRTVTITATESLTISSLTSSSSQFVRGATSPGLPATLATGQKIEVPVSFRPSTTGPIGGTLKATTTSGKQVEFSLSGTGQASEARLEVIPTVLTFGGAAVGQSKSASATFRNVGASPLTINKVNLPAAPFSAEGAPAAGSTIAPSHTLTITVTFEPTATGSFGGELGLETTAGNGSIQLTGSSAAPAQLQITPETNEYGSVAIGKEVTRSFTVSNLGGESLQIYKSKPPSGGEFTATTSLPEDTTLHAGESIKESVTFKPTAAGSASGVWLINGEGSTTVHEVKFVGTGVPLTVAPELTEFGAVPVGGEALGTYAIENLGDEPVTITSSQPPAGSFSPTTSLAPGRTIAPGESISENVVFKPTALGPANGLWRFSDSAGYVYEAEFDGLGAPPTLPGSLLAPQSPVTTSNVAGSREVAPPGPAQTINASLASSAVTASRSGVLSLKLRCPAGQTACGGSIVLQTISAVKAAGHKPAILTLATGSFRISAGRTAVVKLRLSTRARAMLGRRHVLRVRATIKTRQSAGALHTTQRTLTIRMGAH